MDDLRTLKSRYEVASGVYCDIAHRNAEQAMKGTGPTPKDLQRESDAEEALANARQEYRAALGAPARDTD